MAEFSYDNVLFAVKTAYGNAQVDMQKNACEFLTAFEKSDHAFEMLVAMLESEGVIERTYAAQRIRIKIERGELKTSAMLGLLVNKVRSLRGDAAGMKDLIGGIVQIMVHLSDWGIFDQFMVGGDVQTVLIFVRECLRETDLRPIIKERLSSIIPLVHSHLHAYEDARRCVKRLLHMCDESTILPLFKTLLECPIDNSVTDALNGLAHFSKDNPTILISLIPSLLPLRDVFKSAVFEGDNSKVTKLSFIISDIGCAMIPHLQLALPLVDMQMDLLYSRHLKAIINGLYFFNTLLLNSIQYNIHQFVVALCHICTCQTIRDEAEDALSQMMSLNLTGLVNAQVMAVLQETGEYYESCLFILSRVNNRRTSHVDAQLILQHIYSKPPGPYSVQLMGILAHRTNSIDQIINHVQTALSYPELSQSASIALSSICNDCRIEYTSPFLVPFLQCTLHNCPQHAQSVICSLIHSIATLPAQQFSHYFQSMIQLVQHYSVDHVMFIKLVSSSFMSLTNHEESPHPATNGLVLIWPTLIHLFARVINDTTASELYARCMRHIIRYVNLTGEMVNSVTSVIIRYFNDFQDTSLVYLAAILIEQYSAAIDIPVLLSTIIPPSLIILKDSDSVKNNPDYAEDFFRLSSRLVNHCMDSFTQYSLHIIRCAFFALFCENKNVISQCCSFVCCMLTKTQPSLQLTQQLLSQILLSSICHPTHLNSIAKCVHQIGKMESDVFCALLQCTLSELPRSGEHVRGTISDDVVVSFYQNVISKIDNIKHIRLSLEQLRKHFII